MQDADVFPTDITVGLGERLNLESDGVHDLLFHF